MANICQPVCLSIELSLTQFSSTCSQRLPVVSFASFNFFPFCDVNEKKKKKKRIFKNQTFYHHLFIHISVATCSIPHLRFYPDCCFSVLIINVTFLYLHRLICFLPFYVSLRLPLSHPRYVSFLYLCLHLFISGTSNFPIILALQHS